MEHGRIGFITTIISLSKTMKDTDGPILSGKAGYDFIFVKYKCDLDLINFGVLWRIIIHYK
jgi:hypothetical protein